MMDDRCYDEYIDDCKAYGKCLVVGGYAILYEGQPGLVVASPHYFLTTFAEIHRVHGEGPKKLEVVVRTPQFPNDIAYNVRWNIATRSPELVSGNPFIDAAICNTLFAATIHDSDTSQFPSKLVLVVNQTSGFIRKKHMLIDNDDSVFPLYNCCVSKAEKTGLGSSSALMSSLVGVLLKNLTQLKDEKLLVTTELVSQLANNQAQAKQGSGFDICAAVYGTHRFLRMDPKKLTEAAKVLHSNSTELSLRDFIEMYGRKEKPASFEIVGLQLALLEFAKGTDTRIAVKQVVGWLDDNPDSKFNFLGNSTKFVDGIENCLKKRERSELAELCREYRKMMKKLGEKCGVEIEPNESSPILDMLMQLGAILAVCPGAGGYDALAILIDSKLSKQELEALLKKCQDNLKHPGLSLIC